MKITRNNAKELGIDDFDILIEDFLENSYQKHRKGSNFFTKSIVEINKEWFPELSRELDGFYETNEYIWDDNYGKDDSEIDTLTKVERREKIIKSTEWIEI